MKKYFKIPEERKSEFDINISNYQAIEPIATIHGYYVIPYDVIEGFQITGKLAQKLLALETVFLNSEDFIVEI